MNRMNRLFKKGWKNDIDMKIDNLQLLYDIDKIIQQNLK